MFAKLIMPLQAAYCASKHALLALQNSAAAEAAASGVRVNSVSPGFCRCQGLRFSMFRPFFVFFFLSFERRPKP
jgi:NAD(P)-dependent dehydrogenase (short-subunit alcohol dehydrogenase family)